MMHSLFDLNMTHYFLVTVQMDELQSGPLMVKSLTGRNFAVELWLREPILVCGIKRRTSMILLVKLSYMDSTCHAIFGGMWNVT
jgi:hypothetical protein